MGNRKTVYNEAFNEPFSNALSVTELAEPLSSTSTEIFGVIVQNDKDSAVDAYIGGPFRQDFRLDQGESVELRVCNLNLIYARTETGTARIRYLAYRADI